MIDCDTVDPYILQALDQVYSDVDPVEFQAWVQWTQTQPDYYHARVGSSTCIVKVYNQIDPPWKRVACEVAWCGRGRDAVRALHRGMDWARLQGAELFGYSLAPHLDTMKWRTLK